MDKKLIRKIFLCLLLPVIIFACNLPLNKTSPTDTELPTVTPYLMPNLPLAQKTLRILPTATTAPTIDDFFARCPTAAEIASVDKDLDLKFETDPTAGTLACKASDGSADLTTLQERAYQSVVIMKYLTFDAPLPWTDKNLFVWFTGTIKGIRFRSDIQYNSCCQPANVINIKVADNSYLMVTPRWIDPTVGGGLMDTMVLYVHEARHNEGFPHTCANGQDDKTIAEKGAWGVQYYLLEWLAQHSERAFLRTTGPEPEIYRMIALNDSLMIQRASFCNEPTATPGDPPTLAP
jgi:hypothetical protein